MSTGEKEHLRQAILERLKAMSTEEKQAEGRSISRRLLEHIPTNATVCAFYPMPTEADITLLLEELLKRGNSVYLPCFVDATTEFRQLDSLDALEKGALGTLEPPKYATVLELVDVNVALLPGLAFDREGNRLGRGNGGYDRWLQKLRAVNTNAQCIGIAMECQLTQHIPVQNHDEPVDIVATARELL